MARHLVSSSMLKAIVALVLILGAAGAALVASHPSDQPNLARTLQTPGLGNITVTVTDNAGRPVANATVLLNGTLENFTLEDGTCRIDNLSANESGIPYTLSASAPGYLDSNSTIVLVIENLTTNVTLEIRGGWMYGTVTSATGPISGAVVTITDLDYYTNASPINGFYSLYGLPAGPHNVTVTAQGYSTQPPTAVYIPLAGAAEVHFVLTALGGNISGRIYHQALLTPLNYTNVSVQIGDLTVTRQSDPDGNYNFENVPEGIYTVTATRIGFYPASRTDVPVTRGNTTSGIDLYLSERPTRLYGVVRSGQILLVGANISVAGTEIYTLSGADGNYEIRNLTSGTYDITATVQGYETQTVSAVQVLSESDTQLNFNMTGLPGAKLRGTVKDSRTSAPLANVLVTVIDLSPQPRSVFTNINGEFEFPALPVDNYTLRFEKTGYRPLEISEIEALESSTEIIEFQMTPLRETFTGFIEGLDMAHSMMLLALALTFTILGVAVVLRIRTFISPANAPAVYDQSEEENDKEESVMETPDEDVDPSEDDVNATKSKKIRKLK